MEETLDAQVNAAPLLRRVATPDDLREPSALLCFRHERAAALSWFRQQTSRAPEACATLDGPWRTWRHVTLAPGLQAVVFGARLRSKATHLASHGSARLLYASDPELGGYRTAPDFLERHRDALERLWRCLADDESRLVLAALLRQRLTGDHGYLRVSRFTEYCHPRVKAEPGDVVIDAGAFNGATSAAFARQVGKSGRVYAFEPSRHNRQLIARRLRRPWNWRLRVEVVPQALSSYVGSAYLESARGGSGALRHEGADAGLEATPVTTLDAFASDGKRVDLVSLDVEGAEPAALAGAERLIREQRPKLQISVYHQLQHVFEIPLALLERHPSYELYLGHHDVHSTETDAYLLPRQAQQ